MATQGLKPVAEFQFMGFIHPAMDHILNHASRMRTRTSGRLHCPIVFRAPFGGGAFVLQSIILKATKRYLPTSRAFSGHSVYPTEKPYGLFTGRYSRPRPNRVFGTQASLSCYQTRGP